MEGSTFFELPLERDFYVAKCPKTVKKPLRVLITEAGTRIAYCLIYKICKGDVFGPDQEIILHLVNSRGVVDHKSILIELEECGFHLLKDSVVTSNPAEAYNEVDVIVLLNILEEESGFSFSETIVSRLIKLRQLARNIAEYCKPNVKIISAAPSTKSAMLVMLFIKKLEPRLCIENLTTVTLLDEAVAKSHLAARLKVTTNLIKNVIIWGVTCADVRNATVSIYPSGDLGCDELKDVPVAEALKDDKWLRDEFVQHVYKRTIGTELAKSGKSLALAIGRHLRALFMGTDQEDEFVSMGVLAPEGNAYLVPKNTPFSFPVSAKDGNWRIVDDLKYDVRTHLCMLGSLQRLESDKAIVSIYKIIERIINYEKIYNEMIFIGNRRDLMNLIDVEDWQTKYFFCPLPEEAIPKHTEEKSKIRKSIAWEDVIAPKKRLDEDFRKSSIRFSFDDSRKIRTAENKRNSILKIPSSERVVLPPIRPKSGKKT